MKLVTLEEGIGRVAGDVVEVLDLDAADLGGLLAGPGLAAAFSAGVRGKVALDDVALRAPVPQPPKVICIGINYEQHVEELRSVIGDFPMPNVPVFFFIPSSAVCGPYDDLVRPRIAPDQVDHECELAVVIGRGGNDIGTSDAWSYVAGVTLMDDFGARDVQAKAMAGPAFELSHAKGFDTFKPMGPFLTTADEFADGVVDVELTCSVNGEVFQRVRTSEMIFDIATCIAHVSTYVSLVPGDVILTGSPAGVGFFSGRFLHEGDVVEVAAAGLGAIRNTVVSAPALD